MISLLYIDLYITLKQSGTIPQCNFGNESQSSAIKKLVSDKRSDSNHLIRRTFRNDALDILNHMLTVPSTIWTFKQ